MICTAINLRQLIAFYISGLAPAPA
jgi:hypothetical protein